MAKKRATLPPDFTGIMERNNIEELKVVFDKCDINAYERDSLKTPALCMYSISTEFIKWLIDNGANIEAKDTYGRTALNRHSQVNQVEKVKLLLDNGADIHTTDCYKNTPLHAAEYQFETVCLLLERGANPLAKNDKQQTPMLYMLARCSNIDISDAAKVAELLLKSGDKVTKKAQEHITRIGENFEFHRKNFNPDYLKKTEEGLQKLYELFKIKPVEQRIMHDGASPIVIQADTWQKQFEKLWNLLVPSSGKADTVQGEIIRIAGKVGDEIMRNGACNWNGNFKKMLSAVVNYVQMGNSFDENLIKETEQLKQALYQGDDDEDALDRLAELAVLWVTNNPEPIALGKVDYKN